MFSVASDMATHIGAIKARCKLRKYLSTPRNNELLLGFLQAKENGGYGRLIFNAVAEVERTFVKKSMNLKKIDAHFSKDFDKITEDEFLAFRDKLNKGDIKANKVTIRWRKENGKPIPEYRITETDRPLAYRTKIDYRANFVEFYKYVIEAHFQAHKEEIQEGRARELPDITKHFKLKRDGDFSPIKVDFIPDDELHTLLNHIYNRDFKALVQLSLMSGARPCEILNVRMGRGYNLYKNKENKWVVHLPRIKKISYAKFPLVVDMYEEDLYPYFENLKVKEGDQVFKTSEATFRKLMRHYSMRNLGKAYPPGVLRKTARMLRTNAGYSHDWINKLMGHAPGSRIQGHYTNYEGIKNEPEANERLKAQQYPSLKRDYEQLKLQQQAQAEEMKRMQEQHEQLMKALQLKKLASKKLA